MADGRRLPYWAWFTILVVLSLGVLLSIVFAVFPQRFVLVPGLYEQDLNFPATAPAFGAPPQIELLRPRAPVEVRELGPAERFWEEVTALADAGREEEALPVFRAWLEERPEDHGARLEYARALHRADRLFQAERAYARVARATDDDEVLAELADVRWRVGDLTGALEALEELEDRRPGDPGLRRDRARLLSALGRHVEAARLYRRLVEDAPEDGTLRLEFARALRAAGWVPSAWHQAAMVSPDDPAAPTAAALKAELRAALQLPSTELVTGPVLERARAAAADDDLEEAVRLYRVALFFHWRDEERRLELAELLATRLEDPAGAVRVLERHAARAGTDPSPELRRRLARYRLWAGDDEGARRELEALAAEGATTADDLAVLADLYRWEGDRPRAARLYGDALSLDLLHDRAREGRDALAADVRRAVQLQDPAGAAVDAEVFSDSDDFRSWGVKGEAVLDPGWDAHRLLAASGVRSVRGPSLQGPLQEEIGPVGELGWVGWWRQASIRTEVRAGVERFDVTGAEPFFRADIEMPGTGVRIGYRHGLAHPTTLSFASIQDRTRLDGVEASLYRELGSGPWALWTAAEAASVRGGDVDNGRFVGQATVDRAFGEDGLFRAGYSTRLLSTVDPAPVTVTGRDLYWAPEFSWGHGIQLGVGQPAEGPGLGWRVRAQPGAALVRLHGDDEPTDLEFRFSAESGLEYRTERASLRLQANYLRSRVDGYEAVGGSLGLFWRF